MAPDAELLTKYVGARDAEAFAEIARSHDACDKSLVRPPFLVIAVLSGFRL